MNIVPINRGGSGRKKIAVVGSGISGASAAWALNPVADVTVYEGSDKPGGHLRSFVDRLLAGAGLKQPAIRVLLLAYPRMFGYAFNPISIYFCYGKMARWSR